MFDLPLRCQLLQGPVVRTWNCVTNFANLLWYKFYHIGYLTMPRSRRRHHSRSRTRSRSNSVERTRDVKRRKIDSYEETHKRSLSSETVEPDQVVTPTKKMETSTSEESKIVIPSEETDILEKSQESVASSSANEASKSDCETVKSTNSKSLPSKLKTSEVTPKKALSPLQLQKRLESAKRREEKEKEREEKRLKLLEEKKLLRDEKEKQRLEKQEQKQKELEMKEDKRKKEQEEKDLKRKREQEEKDMKRKEKEEKIEQKRKEIEEKTKEKQKEENKKQKISAAFVNFFTKKPEAPLEKKVETVLSSTFMPFEVKSDMRLAPLCRKHLSDEQKNHCLTSIKQQACAKNYLEELKNGKEIGTDSKTWIDNEVETDEVVILEDLGESIVHQTDSTQKWRAKFLKFHENRRPAYYGTWRKKSKVITPIKPFGVDEDFFNYEADSDDDWEEEEPGESVGGSDDEEKDEPEIDYDYDNFLVPHGYLSDSEVNDEEDAVANPEDHKMKLKILKKEFDDEMSEKAHKLKPRMVGCIWYNKNEMNVDENTHNFLKPYFIIAREQIKIKKRLANEVANVKSSIKSSPKAIANPLEDELIPEFLKFVHGSSVGQKTLVKEYLKILKDKGINCDASQKSLQLQLKTLAEWKRSQNKFCWCVRETVMKTYKVELPHV